MDARAEGRSKLLQRLRSVSPPVAFQHLVALVSYWMIAIVLYGVKISGHFGDRLLSSTPADASFFVWALRWWPHAIGHGLNPLYTHVVYAPTGFNMTWTTGIPGPSIVMAPFTLAFGPAVAFNILALLAPATAAWTAYLLCRRVTRSGLAAFAGGFFFGFSTFESLVVSAGHLNLSLALVIPICAYLFIRHLEGSMSDRRFVLLLAAALVGQFLISIEVFATTTLVGALTILIGMGFAGRAWRHLARTARLAALAYGGAAIVLAPYLFVAFAYPKPTKVLARLSADRAPHASTALQGFVIPARVTQFGHGLLFHGSVPKNGLYLGVPLLLILLLVAITRWHSAVVRTLSVAFVLIAALALGAYLRVGSEAVPLPWAAVVRLPLMRQVAAPRFIVFAFLIAAVAVAVWAAGARGRARWVRWALVGLAGLAIVPSLAPHGWTSSFSVPPFVSTGEYRRYLTPGETVVVIASGRAPQMYWQAASGMYFRLAGGYMGATPHDFPDVGFGRRLAAGFISPADDAMLRRFVSEHGIGAILIAGSQPEAEATLRRLVGAPIRIGGVVLFRMPPSWLGGGHPVGFP